MPAAAPGVTLPAGFRVSHSTDRERWTGCTVVLAPEDCVASCEVRGGGPGTRETDLLSPAAAAPGAQAVLLTGGSAFGLAAADGVARWLAEDGSALAGMWEDGSYVRSADVLLERGAALTAFRRGQGPPQARPWALESSTLVCVLTDARLANTEAWLVARSASSRVARAVVAAEVTAAAIRDAVRQTTGAPGCPASAER